MIHLLLSGIGEQQGTVLPIVTTWLHDFDKYIYIKCDALHDLVSFVHFKKREKHSSMGAFHVFLNCAFPGCFSCIQLCRSVGVFQSYMTSLK